jgi:hypothetical protein
MPDSTPFLWYLASPSSHDNPNVTKTRLVKVGKLAALLFKKGIHTFPVMSATASIAKYGKIIDTTWSHWENLDTNYLSRCDGILISTLDDEWFMSVGMRAEVEFARDNCIPAAMVDTKGNITRMSYNDILRKFDILRMTHETMQALKGVKSK